MNALDLWQFTPLHEAASKARSAASEVHVYIQMYSLLEPVLVPLCPAWTDETEFHFPSNLLRQMELGSPFATGFHFTRHMLYTLVYTYCIVKFLFLGRVDPSSSILLGKVDPGSIHFAVKNFSVDPYLEWRCAVSY